MKMIATFTLMLMALPLAAQDADLEVSKVAGSIHMISGRGGNIGVSAGANGLLMIDDKFAPLAEQIRAALSSLNDGELKFLLNTHFHGDHTGGNRIFGVDTPIIAHANVRTRLATERRRGERVTPAAPAEALPVITFDSALSIHFNGEEVKVLHIPNAHTDGDALVFFTGSNVVHMGDTFFNQRFPFVDIDSGGSVEGVIAAVETVLASIDGETKIIPGHGALATMADLKTYLRMLQETQALVAQGVQKGESLEALQSAGIGGEWASWGGGFISAERWIATLHRSLDQ